MKLVLVGLLICTAAFGVQSRNAEATLSEVKRVYVDQLGGGAASDQMRDMLISALQESGLFVVTESPERADALLKGSSDDKVFTQEHDTSDSIGFHAGDASGTHNAVSIGTSSSSNKSMSAGVSQSESSHIQDRRHEAVAAVRLVNGVGDVIWSTTQESNGAKFKGAMADVADKVVRRLAEETKKARVADRAPAIRPGEAKPGELPPAGLPVPGSASGQ
ncbi:MAG TPA: hypothetical protein VFC21_04395 [Bryobacteraceae bacterium]|nr:hypothetical protein [Bryobacteraceae bacterium]